MNSWQNIKKCVQKAPSTTTALSDDLAAEPDFQIIKRLQYLKCRFHYEDCDEPNKTLEKK